MSLEERNRLVASYYLQMYRLKQKELQAIHSIAAIDIHLGTDPLQGLPQCQDPRFPETKTLCQNLHRDCRKTDQEKREGLESLTQQTISNIQRRNEIDTKIRGLSLGGSSYCLLQVNEGACRQKGGTWVSGICSAPNSVRSSQQCAAQGGSWGGSRLRVAQLEVLKFERDRIDKEFPWITQDKFKSSLRGLHPDSVKKALRDQLQVNREATYAQLNRYRDASACLVGTDSDDTCDHADATLRHLGAVPGPTMPRASPETIADANLYLNRATCEIAHRRESREALGLDMTMELFMANSAVVIASAVAPELRLLRTLALVVDAGAAGASFHQAIQACREGPQSKLKGDEPAAVAAIRQGQPFSKNLCPKVEKSYAQTLQTEVDSCIMEVALASLDLAPFAPHGIAKLANAERFTELALRLPPEFFRGVSNLSSADQKLIYRLGKGDPEKAKAFANVLGANGVTPEAREALLREMKKWDSAKFDAEADRAIRMLSQGCQ